MTLTYYARHGAFTEVNDHGALFETLTSDVAGLCRVGAQYLISSRIPYAVKYVGRCDGVS